MTFGVMIRRHHVKHRLPGRPQGTNNSQSRVDHVARRVNSASPEVSPPTHHLITWNSGAISEGATPFTHPHLCAFPQGPPCSSILSKFQLSSRLSSNVTSSAKATPTHAKMNTPSSQLLPRAGLVSGVALFFYHLSTRPSQTLSEVLYPGHLLGIPSTQHTVTDRVGA